MLYDWLSLYHSPGVGPIKFAQYLKIDPDLCQIKYYFKPDIAGVERDLQWQEQTADAHIITLDDSRYPELLKKISDPPPILYVLGDHTCLKRQQIAIVGSRKATSYGLKQAFNFAAKMAQLNLVVTSGLALGIDTASHKGALSIAHGQSIAVLGHGLDIVYPSINKLLADQIVNRGCLVSEFPIGTAIEPWNFPRRNRIISGLSLGVIVVEATKDSGSLITARYAAEQNREVFAIPGAINNPCVKGCHDLIRQGAKLVDCEEDVLEELTALLNYAIRDKTATTVPLEEQLAGLSQQQMKLVNMIDNDVATVDFLIETTGWKADIVLAELLNLELNGIISAVQGGYVRKLN